MNNKKSIILVFGIMIILVIAVIVISSYLWKGIGAKNNSIANIPKKDKIVACTEEAKICLDGSAVSRIQPNCEFAPCPEIVGIADKLIISSIRPNDEIASPVTILGRARGSWFFEGSFQIEIYDDNGKLLIATNALFIPKSEEDTWMTEDFVDFKSIINFGEPSAGSGYILFKKDNPSGKPENEESFKLSVKFNQSANENADALNWQVYTNAEYGFEYKYPKEWNIDQDRTTENEVVFDIGIPESRESIEFFKNTKNLTLDQLKIKKVTDAEVIEDQSEMTIDGEKASLIKTTEFGMNYVIFNHKSNAYIVTTGGRILDDGILSTFKFIN